MKAVLAALALLTLSAGAFATEATQFNDTPTASSARAPRMPTPLTQLLGRSVGDATVFIDSAPGTTTRADVRAAARAIARSGPGLSYGEATVWAEPLPR